MLNKKTCHRFLVSACLGLLMPLHVAATPVDRLLPPKPEIEQYANQDAFVRDVLKWKRQKLLLEEQYRKGELKLPAEKPTHDPNDWHHVTGPENLEQAVKNAEGYEQPHYKERLRFDRTTHISFPLQKLPSNDMAQQQIQGALPDAPQVTHNPQKNLPELILKEAQKIKQPPTTTAKPVLPDLLQENTLTAQRVP